MFVLQQRLIVASALLAVCQQDEQLQLGMFAGRRVGLLVC